MPCQFSCHYVWLTLHVLSFCYSQYAYALLLIPAGVFVAGSCTGMVCDPACAPGGRRWLCDCHWESEGEGPAGDGGQKQDCFCGQKGHQWFPAEVTGILSILEYPWLCLQFIDLNHHPSADTRSQHLASLWQFCHQRFQKFILYMTMYVAADVLKSTWFWYVLNCITWACSDPRRCAGSVTVLEGIYNIIWSICVVMWHTSYIVWSFGQNVCLRWNEYSLS